MDSRHTIIQGTWAYSAPRLYKEGSLTVGSKIRLRRESANTHDRNAVAVFTGRSKVGYLPRALAAELAFYLDKDGKYQSAISRVGMRTHKGSKYPSIYIDLTLNSLSSPEGFGALLNAASRLSGARGVYSRS